VGGEELALMLASRLAPHEDAAARKDGLEQRLALSGGRQQRHPVSNGGHRLGAMGVVQEPSRGAREERPLGRLGGEEPALLAHHTARDEGKGGLREEKGKRVGEV
jgi:hypothetical protein